MIKKIFYGIVIVLSIFLFLTQVNWEKADAACNAGYTCHAGSSCPLGCTPQPALCTTLSGFSGVCCSCITPTPTPLPCNNTQCSDVITQYNNSGYVCWPSTPPYGAPANTCSACNTMVSCGPSQTMPATFLIPCTVNNCNAGLVCISGACVVPTPTPTRTPTPTPTPLPNCTTGASGCSSCAAPGNTCSNGNGTQTCTHDGPSPCNPVVFTQSCTANNCNAGNVCVSGKCVAPTPTPTPTPTPLPNCTTGSINCTACSAPLNTCSTGNGTQTCQHNGPSPCTVTNFSQSCTVNNCNAGSVCVSGTCVIPTPTPTPTPIVFSISGSVFSDYNHNGVKDSGEPGTANITVTATGGSGTYTAPPTDVNGNFTVANVPNGTYSLTMTVPAGNVASTSNPVPNVRVNGANVSGISFGLTPLSKIAGTVYNDITKSTYFNGVNTPHTANNTVTFSGPTNTSLTTNNAGAYSSGQVLLPGVYQVTYTIPSSYAVTYPGPPPTFQVTVGKPGSGSGTSCSVGSYHDASCDSSGNISGMDYGITNEFSWIQGVCSNFRMDNGFTDLLPFPGGSGTTCGGIANNFNSYATITDPFSSSCTNPGIIASGDSFSSFGQGQASANPYNWVIGGPAIPETFTPTNPTVIRTSYSYMKTTAVQAGITPTDLSGNDSVSGLPFCGAGGIANCTLETNLPNDVYIANGNLTLNTYTFPTNKNFVILVNGNLTIMGNILVPTGSDAIFTVSGNIIVDKSVGITPLSSDSSIQGLYSTDKSFIINSFAVSPNQCNSDGTPKDKRLNITGSIVVNAAGTGGSFQNLRDLCQSDLSCPTVTIGLGNGDTSGTNFNPGSNPAHAGNGLSYLLFAPSFIKHTNYLWQEVAP